MILKREELPNIPKANNFDFLRFVLACAVACCHYYRMTGRPSLASPITSPTAVSGFFAISGFLIFMSFCNSQSFKEYLIKRVRRIFPAYIGIVIVAFLLFSLVSTLDWQDYFTSKDSLRYLLANLSFCNFLHPTLPGVLADAPYTDSINPSLWTLKIELALYLCIPFIALLAVRNKVVLPLLTVAISILCYYLNWKADTTQILLYEKIGTILYQGNMFIIGSCLFLFFDKIYPYRYYILILSLALYPLKESGWPDIIFPFALAGCIFGLAFTLSFLNNFGRIGDLSYGVYLFHAPIIQFFTAKGWNDEDRLPLVLAITFTLAFLSWHLMEKRILKRQRKQIK
ncbi:MAG: acyltransferase [Paludibacteraceae bacterium]|nr:acyltransferase [Paludibacteraceae bacterium]